MKFSLTLITGLVVSVSVSALAAGDAKLLKIPDFTKGGKIPKSAPHDWNLGPTGLRGGMFCDQMVTSDARQIAITKVDKDSPTASDFKVGDVLLGVGGKAFSYDPRTELGKAITAAESETGGGKLGLTRWRAGKSEEILVKLQVLGSYSSTAPFDCAKSKRILEQGCKALALRMEKPTDEELDSIVRSINALALLASGDAAHLPLVKREAEWAARDFSEDSMKSWYYGYVMMLLACAMPLKKIYLTGKRPRITPQLDAAAAQSLINDGCGWNNKDRHGTYDKLSEAQLLERLGSWAPTRCASVPRLHWSGGRKRPFQPCKKCWSPPRWRPATARARHSG